MTNANYPNHSLNGSYKIGGKTLYDPPADEPQNNHVYFAVEGKAARDIFESMKTKAMRDQCLADGSMTKRISGMQYTQSNGGKKIPVLVRDRYQDTENGCWGFVLMNSPIQPNLSTNAGAQKRAGYRAR